MSDNNLRYAALYTNLSSFKIRVGRDLDEALSELKRRQKYYAIPVLSSHSRIMGANLLVRFQNSRTPKEILKEFLNIYLKGGKQTVDAETRGERFSVLTYSLDTDNIILQEFLKYFYVVQK